MSEIDEAYVVKQYKNQKSTTDIAKELNTYPKKIQRILKRNGCPLRSKSQAQILALKTGNSKHPTSGKARTEAEKNSISSGVHNNWKTKPEKAKNKISREAKKRWDQMPENKKRHIQEAAGRALREASINGSKAERLLADRLREIGYEVVLHKKNLIPGNYEIDLFMPELKTAIEIDGPQHFLPIWGEEKLKSTIKFDQNKNGLLLSHGYCIIRVKYMCKNMTRNLGKKLCELVEAEVDNISNKFPTEGKRFIELEIIND